MKPSLLITLLLAVLTFSVATPRSSYALFGRTAAEKQRRIEAEQKLVQQQQLTGKWQTTAFGLGIGCVVTLVAGAAIGSKGRQDATKPKK